MAEFLTDEIDFAQYLKETDAQAKVKKAGVWINSMKERLRSHSTEKKVCMPWDHTHGNFQFRKGEVTVWGGINGHGKSLVTTQVALSLMGQEESVCIASFEMKPMRTLERMGRMYNGCNPFSPEFQNGIGLQAIDELYDEFGEWSDGRLWLYDQQGTTDTATVIGMVKYCAKELKIAHIFIDNLAKCVKNEDDYNAQKSFMEELCAIARDYECHIHVVHHMRKGNKETDPLDKNDFKGSGSITDQPDNLIGVWRNKAKELERKLGTDKRKDEPDTTLRVFKQRNYEGSGDGEPLIGLWMHLDSWQFLARDSDPVMYFRNWPHRHTSY
jgi:twinkle protein